MKNKEFLLKYILKLITSPKVYFFSILLSIATVSFAQKDSIITQDGYRTFIVHLPTGYNSANKYPLVLNFHGLNATAATQQSYSKFDDVADTANFIVVYPQGINNVFNLNTSTAPHDIDFASALIDSLKQQYSIENSCVFSTGMSNGGFFSYLIACNLSNKITAVAPVAGNLSNNAQNACSPSKTIPLLEIHGTDDTFVDYGGMLGVPSVRTTVKFWQTQNNCDTGAVQTSLPNIDPNDGCTVDIFTYKNCDNNSEVIHYRINGGGHTWPGGIPIGPFGATCQDFKASAVIWNFFRKYCAANTSSINKSENINFELFPNPSSNFLYFKTDANKNGQKQLIKIIDVLGNIVLEKSIDSNDDFIDINNLTKGLYSIHFNGASTLVKKFIKL